MKRLLGALAVSALLTISAHAADPIKIVVPFAAGGPVDMLARISRRMHARSSRCGRRGPRRCRRRDRGEQVARAAPTETLLFASLGSHVISPALRRSRATSPLKSFAPVALIGAGRA